MWGFYQGWAVLETDMQEVILHLLIHLENINEINLKTVFKTEKKKKKVYFLLVWKQLAAQCIIYTSCNTWQYLLKL